MKTTIAAILLLALSATATALETYVPSLVVDADTRPTTAGSEPRDFVRHGGEIYFSARRAGVSSGIFAIDTTTGALRLVTDLAPGASGSLPRVLGVVGGRLIAAANVGEGGTWPSERLWSVDPQSGQFSALSTQPPGAFGTVPLGVVGDRAIFANYSASEIWGSDGSPAGTRRLFESGGPGVDPYFPYTVCVAHDRVMFTRRTQAALELWRSDGTLAGTQLVAALPDPGNTAHTAALGGLCHISTQRNSGWGLWRSDGTAAGTVLLHESATGSPVGLAATASAVFLLSSEGPGVVLRRADQPQPLASLPDDTFHFAATPTHLVFTTVVSGSRRVMISDGSGAAAQTVLFNGTPLSAGTTASTLPVIGPLLFLRTGDHLYSIDAAQATASLVAADADVFGTTYSTIHVDGVAYGAGIDAYGNEVWRSDGTAAGTRRLHDIAESNASGLQSGTATVRDGIVYFNAVDSVVDGSQRRGVWRSDGTAAGTYALARDRYDAGDVSTLMPFDGGIAFAGRRSTTPSTTRAYRVDTGFSTAQPLFEGSSSTPQLYGNESLLLYACAWTAGTDSLCTQRSGETQTTIVAAASGTSTFRPLQTVGNAMVYFHRNALWRSDGTAPGTFALASLRYWQYWWLTSPPLPPPVRSQLFGGRLYFQGCSAADVATCGLYATDGIGEPERLAAVSASVASMTTHAGRLAFVANPATQPTAQPGRLWFSAGTPQTTEATITMAEGAVPISAGGLLHFIGPLAGVPANRTYVVSDGTPAGTRDVALPAGAFPVGDFVHFGDDVLFSCFAPGRGYELCVVDAAGTGLQGIVEIAPGAEHSYARFLTATADALYFRATDGMHGYELWRLNRDRIFASGIE